MDLKRQNNEDGRNRLIQLEETCSSAFREFSQNFGEFYQNLEPFSPPQSFSLTFKGTFTEDLLIEAFY